MLAFKLETVILVVKALWGIPIKSVWLDALWGNSNISATGVNLDK